MTVIPPHLADLLAEFPPHSEWECGGRRLTAVGINSRLTAVLAEHDHILVRVPIDDARATWVRVVPAPPLLVDPEHIYGVDTIHGDLFSLTVNAWDGKCPRIRVTAYEVVA